MDSLLIKNKNFRNIFVGNAVSQIGDLLFSFSIGFYLLSIGQSVIVFSTFIAYSFGIELILKLFSSVLAERFNKKKIIVNTDLLNGVLLLLCSYFLFDIGGNITLIYIYLIRTFLAITNALFSPAASTLMRLLVEDDDLQEMYALRSIMMKSRGIIGVLIAASLFDVFGIRTIFILNGISFLISAIMEMRIVSDEKNLKQRISLSIFISDIVDVTKYLFSNKPVIEYTLIGCISNIALIGFIPVFMKYFVFEMLAYKTIFYSLLQVAILSGQIIGGIYVRKRKLKAYKTFLWGNLIVTIIFILLGFAFVYIESKTTLLIVNYLMFFIFGISLSIINVPIVSEIMKSIDKNYFARSGTLLNLISSATGPISMYIYGVFIDINLVGFSYLYIVIIMIITFVVILRSKFMRLMDIKDMQMDKVIS